VGLVARAVEASGIPTVTLSVVRNMTEALPAPRNVLVKFRLGQVFGEPGHTAQQRTILRAALAAQDAVTESGGIVELPYRWKREVYESA
jgi:D-proline reductase (dithiol) PrdB